jgi:hypothetical protein
LFGHRWATLAEYLNPGEIPFGRLFLFIIVLNGATIVKTVRFSAIPFPLVPAWGKHFARWDRTPLFANQLPVHSSPA